MRRDLQRLETATQAQLDELSRCVEWLQRQPTRGADSEQVALDVGDSSGAPRSIASARAMVEELERSLQQSRLAVQRYAATSAPYAVVQSHTGRADGFAFDLRRLQGVIQELADRDALLGEATHGSATLTERYDQLVRERSTIGSSQSTADDILAQAHATRDSLYDQNRTLGGTQNRLFGALARFPEINNIMGKIKQKKWRNKIILWSAILVGCLIIVFWYLPARSAPASEESASS